MRNASKLTRLSAALWFAAIVTGCAVTPEALERADDAEVDFGGGGGKADGTAICDASTVTAAEYYAQFGYQVLERENGSKRYRIAFVFDGGATLADGNEADLDVFFLPDGRVIVEYAELVRQGAGAEVTNQTVVVSSTRIDEATKSITIKGVGTGTPSSRTDGRGGCAPAINFTFESDLRSPGLAGGAAQIVLGTSTRFVIDPDHLDEVPSADARRWFEQDVASGEIQIRRF